MEAPDIILISQVDLGERARSEYSKIEELAQSILDNGLIQPVVLVDLGEGRFGLDAGGRRMHAVIHAEYTQLYHAVTSDPAKPGYVLKGESFATPLQRLLTELAENLDREDLDWRDNVKLLVKAYRLVRTETAIAGKQILMRDFGAMVGCGYSDIQGAVAIHEDLIINPQRYKDCAGIRSAYAILLKVQAAEVTKVLATRSLTEAKPLLPNEPRVSVQAQREPSIEGETQPPPTIALTRSFILGDSLKFMSTLTEPMFDHIVCDPDYAVSVERLEANMSNAAVGIAQETITESIEHLYTLVRLSATALKPQGFLVLWYDLDHHEKLQRCAIDYGFAVQRWPLIWVKSDYRSNAAPAYNFCKNIEYAMVCRKPNAVLARAQMSSVFTCASGNTTLLFNHPFAKPLEVWKWIYSAIAIKGQTVWDPFLGSGTSAAAAAEWGLRPMGCELNPEHYSNALLNMQRTYRKLLGDAVLFS